MIEHWIWLTQINGLGPCKQRVLLKHFETAENIFDAPENDLAQIVGLKLAQEISTSKSLDYARDVMRLCEHKSIDIIKIDDELFPECMCSIDNQPILIYCKGVMKKYKKTIGIVGARKCTNDDKDECINIVVKSKADGAAIVSGMALGIDGYAHTAAIKNDMYTIAVLGGGVDVCYPKDHKSLYQRIAEEGLMISEYAPGTRHAAYNFPKRNRIIAALADELYVIGAKPGSGSLITAEYAHKMNIPVTKINCIEHAKDQ